MKFLIIEDDPSYIEIVSLCLKLRFPEASLVLASEGDTGVDMARTEKPDLIILDTNIRDINGIDVTRHLRVDSEIPIIVITNRYRDVDIARGLAAGADDYLAKPFSHIEFLARVQAILRRSKKIYIGCEENSFVFDLKIDSRRHEVYLNNKEVQLPPTEYRLLHKVLKIINAPSKKQKETSQSYPQKEK
ncbi:MAG: two component transcriptional regulator, winged helix family [Dehalococcoidia bacterium]|nr:two component transcriptional regulator, winged helix family [Dehalococcoidia bacterium]